MLRMRDRFNVPADVADTVERVQCPSFDIEELHHECLLVFIYISLDQPLHRAYLALLDQTTTRNHGDLVRPVHESVGLPGPQVGCFQLALSDGFSYREARTGNQFV